ncbi:MAG: phosphoglucosamine mutase [Chloroflexota bacterium]|nr:phosphoglucosamine mutase [Chloroflexota bacterium]
MPDKHLFGSSGIRTKVSQELLQIAFRVGLAIGNPQSSIIVACDTRTSSEAMKHSILGGLLGAGANVYDAGVAPTPTLAYAARNFDIGIMITASHNPPEYNGIKLWNSDGSAFGSAQRKELETVLRQKTINSASWHEMGKYLPFSGAAQEHINRILQDFSSTINTKVVVDCGCGTASMVTPHLLRAMGCDVLAISSHPSGFFPRDGEPNAESLKHLSSLVKATGYDIGIAHDGDADRMMVVDENGVFVPGDKLLVLIAQALGCRNVITTVETSMAIEEQGFSVVRTEVGDPFVSEQIKKDKADFGGEPSGAWIFPNISYCPDGIYAAAVAAKIAAEEKISTHINSIQSYPLLRGSVQVDTGIMHKLEQELSKISNSDSTTKLSKIDGIRLAFEDGWLLVRPSGTEPKIRLTAEARNQERVDSIYDLGIQAINRCM